MALFNFFIDLIGLPGNVDNGVGQLLLRIVGTARGCAEYGICGVCNFFRDIDNFFRLMLHCQIERANLHDSIDIFVKDLGKLFSAVS